MATTMRRKHSRSAMLLVEFPRKDERIASTDYTIRVSAPESAEKVLVSIDEGEWQPCRPAVGYWWYDWSGYGNGEHRIVVSLETAQGTRVVSEPHEALVDLEPAAAAR